MATIALILIVFACVGVIYLIPYYLKKFVPSNELQKAEDIAQQVVYTIEQTMINVSGETKKAKAMELAKEMLSELGIQVSDEILDTLIEAAVFIMNNTILTLSNKKSPTS